MVHIASKGYYSHVVLRDAHQGSYGRCTKSFWEHMLGWASARAGTYWLNFFYLVFLLSNYVNYKCQIICMLLLETHKHTQVETKLINILKFWVEVNSRNYYSDILTFFVKVNYK